MRTTVSNDRRVEFIIGLALALVLTYLLPSVFMAWGGVWLPLGIALFFFVCSATHKMYEADGKQWVVGTLGFALGEAIILYFIAPMFHLL